MFNWIGWIRVQKNNFVVIPWSRTPTTLPGNSTVYITRIVSLTTEVVYTWSKHSKHLFTVSLTTLVDRLEVQTPPWTRRSPFSLLQTTSSFYPKRSCLSDDLRALYNVETPVFVSSLTNSQPEKQKIRIWYEKGISRGFSSDYRGQWSIVNESLGLFKEIRKS